MRRFLSLSLAVWISVSPFLNSMLKVAFAAPTVAAPVLSVSSVPVGTAMQIIATSKITSGPGDPAVVATGVNLLRVDANNVVLSTVGTMRDDGLNGDALAGDGVFTLRFTVTEAAAGVLRVRVSAAFRGVSLRVLSPVGSVPVQVAQNQPPTFTSTPPTSGTVGLPYSYQATAQDPEGGALKFQLISGPSGIVVGQSTGLVQWTPVTTQNGNQSVQLRVSDPQGLSATQNFVIQVAAANQPPMITSAPVTTAKENTLYQYQVVAQDPEKSPLSYQLLSAPSGMAIGQSTGLIQWTPVKVQVGTQSVQLKVTDPQNASATQSFTIQVAAANLGPVISSVPPITATPTIFYSYQVTAQDPEAGALTYQLVIGPAGMTIGATTGFIQWIPSAAQIGNQNVQLKVVDAQGAEVAQNFTVAVTELNLAPTITSAPVTFAKTSQSYIYNVTAYDPEKKSVQFSFAETPPAGMTINAASGAVNWSPSNSQIGNPRIAVRATDPAGAYDTQAFNLKVFDPANDLQIVSPTGPQSIRIGQTLTLSLQSNYTGAAFSVNPTLSNASVAGANFTFKPASNQEGMQTTTFKASYGDMQKSVVIPITVTRDNSSPVITPITARTVQEGASLTFTIAATDPDNDPLTYAAPGLNLANAFFSTFSRQFTFNPVVGQAGNYQVVFSASDTKATTQIIVPIQVTKSTGQQQVLDLVVDPVNNPTLLGSTNISGNITGQLGTPPPKQAPALVTGLVPSLAKQGQTLTVQLTGLNTNFGQSTSRADFGDGITVNSLTVASATSAQANITIDKLARLGTRTVRMLGAASEASSVVAFNVDKGVATITGIIVDPFTQQPLANARVSINGTNLFALTDSQGRFTLTNVPTGSVPLTITLPNYDVQRVTVAVGVSDTIDLQAPIKLNALARPPNFAGSIPRAATVASVIDRGVGGKGGGLTFDQAKAVVQDTMITVGGIEAGVLDSAGAQLNPKLIGAGEFSLTQEGVEAHAKGLLRGDVITLKDFVTVLTTAFAFPAGLSVGTVVDGFQQAVNQAWADPADPQSAMAIVLFNEGTNLSSNPPIITRDTRFNSFQIFLLTASFLTLNRVNLELSIDSILKARGIDGNSLLPPPRFSRIVTPQEKALAWFDLQKILGGISDWLLPSAFAQTNGACTPQPGCAAAEQVRKKTFTKVWNGMKANLVAEAAQGALVSGALALAQAVAVEAILGFLLVGGITGGLAIGPVLGTLALALIQGAVMVMMFKVVVGWSVAVTAASVETTPPEGKGSTKDSVGNFVITFDASPEHVRAAAPAPLLGAPVLEDFKKRFAYHLYRVPDCVAPVDASTAEYMQIKANPDFTDPVNKHNSSQPFVGRHQFVVPPSLLREGQNCFRIRAFQYLNQSDRFIVEGIEVYDTNNDDVLDFDELRNGGLGDVGTFGLYDVSRDNKLNRDEFNSLYKSRSAAPQDMQIVPGVPGVPGTQRLRALMGALNLTPESFNALRNTAQQQVADIPQRTLGQDSLVGLRTRIADFHADQPFFHYRSNVDFAPQINTFLNNLPAFNLADAVTTAADLSAVQSQLNGDEIVAREIADTAFTKHLGQGPTAEQTAMVQEMVAARREVAKINTQLEFTTIAHDNFVQAFDDVISGKIGPGSKLVLSYPDWSAGTERDPVFRAYVEDVTTENLSRVRGDIETIGRDLNNAKGWSRAFASLYGSPPPGNANEALQARIFDARERFLAAQGPVLKSALQTTSGLSVADVETNFQAYLGLSEKNGVAGLELARQVNGKVDALRALNNEMSQRRATPFDAIEALKKQKEKPVELGKIQKGISGLLNSAGFFMGVSSGLMTFVQSVQVLSSDFSPSCFTTPGSNRVALGVFPPSFEPYPGLDDPNAILVGRKDPNSTNPRIPNGLLVREYPGTDANIASADAGFPAGFVSIDSQERLYALNLNSIDQFGGRIFRYALVPVSGANGGPRSFAVAKRELVGAINYKSPDLQTARPASPVAMVIGPAFQAKAQDGSTVMTQDLFVADTDMVSGQKRILQVATSQIDTIKSFYSDSLGNETNRYRIVGQPVVVSDEFRLTGPSDMEVGPDLSLDKPLLTSNSVIMFSDEDIIWAISHDAAGAYTARKVIQIPGRRWSGLAFDDQGKFYFADYSKNDIFVMKFGNFRQSATQSIQNGSPFISTEILLQEFASRITTLEFAPGDIEMENVSNHPGGVLHISTDQGILPINLPVIGEVGSNVRDIRVKRFSKEEDVEIETQTLFGTSVRTFRVIPSHEDLEILRIPLTVKRVAANGQEYWQDEFIFLGAHGATVLDFPIQ